MLIDSFDTLLFFVVFAVAAAAASFFSSFFDLNTELFSSGFISLLYLILFITNIFCCISNLFLTFCLKCFRPQLYCQLLRYIVLKIFFFLTTVTAVSVTFVEKKVFSFRRRWFFTSFWCSVLFFFFFFLTCFVTFKSYAKKEYIYFLIKLGHG